MFGFQRHRIVKIKVPRPCCPWCEFHLDQTTKQIMALDGKVGALEARGRADQAIQLAKLKLYTSSRVLELLTRGQAPVTITGAQLAQMTELYAQIVQLTDNLMSESGLTLQDASKGLNRPPNPSSNLTSPSSATNGHSSHAVPSQTWP